MRGALRWTRLLLVWAIVSLFAGSFRDASLHPSDLQAVVGSRPVAALHVHGAASALRAIAVARSEAPPAAPLPASTEFAETALHVQPTRTTRFVVLVRHKFAEHAALLC